MTLYQFWAQIMSKMINCEDQDIFPKKTNNMFFMYILVLFLLQDFKITLLSQVTVIKTIIIISLHILALWWSKINIGTMDPEIWGYTIFGSKIVHLPLASLPLEPSIWYSYSYILASILVKILWKSFQQMQS